MEGGGRARKCGRGVESFLLKIAEKGGGETHTQIYKMTYIPSFLFTIFTINYSYSTFF